MRCSGRGVVARAVTLELSGFPDAALAIQALFHDPAPNSWLFASGEPVARLVF